MTRMNWIAAPALVLLLLAAHDAAAGVLLLDFGTTAYSGTNDPAHATGAISNAYTDWHNLTGADAVVTDSAGNSITVNPGRNQSGTAANNGVDFDLTPATVSTTSGAGIFGTTLTRDAIQDAPSFSRDPVAVLISGLPVGQYHVYIVAHYAGNTGNTKYVYADRTALTGGNGTTGSNEIASVTSFPFTDTLEATNTTSWALGDNYTRFTADLTTLLPNLVVAVDAGATDPHNGTIAAIMITPIPEPGSLALLALAGLLVLTPARRGA